VQTGVRTSHAEPTNKLQIPNSNMCDFSRGSLCRDCKPRPCNEGVVRLYSCTPILRNTRSIRSKLDHPVVNGKTRDRYPYGPPTCGYSSEVEQEASTLRARLRNSLSAPINAYVAQLDRAFPYEGKSCGFESYRKLQLE
jgi:hypothetical protein